MEPRRAIYHHVSGLMEELVSKSLSSSQLVHLLCSDLTLCVSASFVGQTNLDEHETKIRERVKDAIERDIKALYPCTYINIC